MIKIDGLNYFSIVIITKNEEHVLERTLTSLVGITDDLVIVDSGSTDSTLAIAKKYGAKILQTEWLGYGAAINHFQQGGGLNLRGYAGYLTPQEAKDGTLRFTFRGTTGWAFNEELDFTKYLPFKPAFTRNWLSLNVYLFGDAGSINYDLPEERIRMSDVRADAGIGVTATIKKFFSLQRVKPFTIRCDFPLWLNRPPAVEGEYLKFRYVIGVGRSF